MKVLYLIIGAALAAVTSHATLIPISAFRDVSISGVASTASYSQSASSSLLGDFSQALSDVAEVGVFHADSRSSQTSAITVNGFTLDLSLFGETRNGFTNPSPGVAASAASAFDFSFNVTQPQAYELSGFRTVFFHDFPIPNFSLLLSNPLGTVLDNFTGATRTGILPPDTYTFHVGTDLHAITDPLGDLKFVDSHIAFNVTSVPEAGSTLLYLSLAMAIFAIVYILKNPNENRTQLHSIPAPRQ